MKNRSVQGLRALFAIGVFLSHSYFLKEYASSSGIFSGFFSGAAVVSFFFMISGFYLNVKKDMYFGTFLKKKIIRIYPLHLLILLAIFLGNIHIFTSFKSWITLLLHVFLMQTWGAGLTVATSFNTVAWFLSSLMFCYLIGYWLMQRKNANEKNRFELYILTAVLLLFKCLVAIYHPSDNIGYYFGYLFPLAGLTDFLIGMILAIHIKQDKEVHKTRTLAQIATLFVMIIMIYCKKYFPINYCRAFLTIPITVAVILAFAKETKFSKIIFGNKVMTFVGDLSFEFYLMHTFVMSIMSKLGVTAFIATNISPFFALIVNGAICILGAYVYKMLSLKVINRRENRQNQGM